MWAFIEKVHPFEKRLENSNFKTSQLIVIQWKYGVVYEIIWKMVKLISSVKKKKLNYFITIVECWWFNRTDIIFIQFYINKTIE